jgi:large subunit ribosomal protein L4
MSAPTLTVTGPQGAIERTVELPAEVFDVAVNVPLIHQVVVAQLAAARQGTADTKTRGEVSGGGRKPYRQKGTGRARQGSTRAPQFAGGGTVHGPTPRSYAQRTPKKMKAAALRGALSDRARNGRLHVVVGLVSGELPSTKTAAAHLALVSEHRHVLVVAERTDHLTWKSVRNLAAVHVIAPDQLNTYDVLVSDDVVFTEGALASFLGRPAPEPFVPEPVTTPPAEPAEQTPAGRSAAAPVDKRAPAKRASRAPKRVEPDSLAETVAETVAGSSDPTAAEAPAKPARRRAAKATPAATEVSAQQADAPATDDAGEAPAKPARARKAKPAAKSAAKPAAEAAAKPARARKAKPAAVPAAEPAAEAAAKPVRARRAKPAAEPVESTPTGNEEQES